MPHISLIVPHRPITTVIRFKVLTTFSAFVLVVVFGLFLAKVMCLAIDPNIGVVLHEQTYATKKILICEEIDQLLGWHC